MTQSSNAQLEDRIRRQEASSRVHVVDSKPRASDGSPGDLRLFLGKTPVLYIKSDKKWLMFVPVEES